MAGRQTGMIALLWKAQGGRCFHCDRLMALEGHREADDAWTREHVWPRGLRRGLLNNIVLAHRRCNRDRGLMQPTSAELARTTAIYAAFGLVAFEPATVLAMSESEKIRRGLTDLEAELDRTVPKGSGRRRVARNPDPLAAAIRAALPDTGS